jgi:hypothetical protein
MARLTVRGIRRAFVVITNRSLERHCPLDARAHGLQSGAAVQVVKVGNPLRAALAKVGHGEEAAHGLRRRARVFHARITGRPNVVIGADDKAQIAELPAQVLRDGRQIPGVEANGHGMACGLEDARARGVSFDYA